MKCKECNTEMYIDHVDELEDTEVFHYKCPNPKLQQTTVIKRKLNKASFFIYKFAWQ